ncbi:DUF305 domain-containing protein [Streptomyces sp. CRN 30]|uniref:DUF305 domain-containing protein n=1 Tax=Streptomyces sp. CRN 30 TaxID=3075613 RepID=UPI002A7FB21D|nr:DUF305 domain-containing protein [Streptomyces sp. CRN 30]
MPFRPAFRASSLVTASLTVAAVLALGACDSGSGDEAGSAASSGPSVIAPGEPGGSNRTLSAQEAQEQRAEDDSPNSADVDYARMMIQHHAQALEMTELVATRAESTPLKRLAERIAASQGPEIEAMRGWLDTYGQQETESGGGHDHATMPGMATDAQLKQLRAAEGEAFDRLFLTLMITHHQGAITMATEVKAQGNNLRVEEMADDVVAQQTSEISRMREML